MIKFLIESEAEIPEGLKEFYVKSDGGKYALQVDGAVPKAKLDEFRSTNISLQQKLKEYEGVDVAKYKELLSRAEELEEGKLLKKEGVESVVQQRLAKVTAEHQRALDQVAAKAEKAEAELARVKVQVALTEPAQRAGLRPEAMPDLMMRANAVWQLKDGRLVAHGPDGGELYGTGGEYLTPAQWIDQLIKDAPHLFGDNKGSGANGGSSGGGYAGPNPWKPATRNLTKQMQIEKTNPDLAKRLRAAALG